MFISTPTDSTLYITCVSVFCCVQYTVFRTVSLRYTLTAKQTAYVISLFSSMSMSILALWSNYYLYTIGYDMYRYRFQANTINEIVSLISSSIFMSAMVMDTVIGTFYYPEAMRTLSGYVHHIFFIFANVLVYYYNGYTLMNLFLIDELPTMILAIGSVFPHLRSDFLFGVAMLSVRILYHGYLSLLNLTYLPAVAVTLPSLFAYIYWFKNWTKKYLM
jgi:hypothetical protein